MANRLVAFRLFDGDTVNGTSSVESGVVDLDAGAALVSPAIDCRTADPDLIQIKSSIIVSSAVGKRR